MPTVTVSDLPRVSRHDRIGLLKVDVEKAGGNAERHRGRQLGR